MVHVISQVPVMADPQVLLHDFTTEHAGQSRIRRQAAA